MGLSKVRCSLIHKSKKGRRREDMSTRLHRRSKLLLHGDPDRVACVLDIEGEMQLKMHISLWEQKQFEPYMEGAGYMCEVLSVADIDGSR